MSELYFLDFMKSALHSIAEYFRCLFSWDKELADEETTSTWENAKDNNETLSAALQALAKAGEAFAKLSRAFGIATKGLFASEKTPKPRMKFASYLKIDNGYNYIPVAKRNMPYQRRSY